jgi:hypothetical protein
MPSPKAKADAVTAGCAKYAVRASRMTSLMLRPSCAHRCRRDFSKGSGSLTVVVMTFSRVILLLLPIKSPL